MNLDELRILADSIKLHRQGNYSEVILENEREGRAVLAYSYENLIGLISPNGEVWTEEQFISNATSQHINLFKTTWGVK